MEPSEFQKTFDLVKSLSNFSNEEGQSSEQTLWAMREECKILARKIMKHDHDVGLMILLVCHWERFREGTSRNRVYRDFSEYLEWLVKNPDKTY